MTFNLSKDIKILLIIFIFSFLYQLANGQDIAFKPENFPGKESELKEALINIQKGDELYFEETPFALNFKKSDIGFFTVKLLDEKGLIHENLFDFLLDDKSCGFQLIRKRSEINTETEFKKLLATIISGLPSPSKSLTVTAYEPDETL